MTFTAGAVFAAMLLILPMASHAACTEQDQESKVNQLGALMTPLSQKDPARAQKISKGMMGAMTQDGDEACASLDKLIAQAK